MKSGTLKTRVPVDAPDIVAVGGVFLLAMFLPLIPLLNVMVWPINELATLIHEMGHALVCVLTGGHVSGMEIIAAGNHAGLTYCLGGIPLLYAPAGYLGTTIAGCATIALARFPHASKPALIAFGVAFGLASLTFMFSGIFNANQMMAVMSMIVGFCLAAAFIRFGFVLSPKWANRLLLFLGAEIALSALGDIWTLVLLSLGFGGGGGGSDAARMAALTGVPALIWALAWGALTIWMLLMTVSWTYDEDFGKKKSV
jgi:hypothetical protein